MATPPATGFWAGLSARERTLLLALALTFFLVSTMLLFYLRSRALRDKRLEIDGYKQALTTVYTKGAVYKDRLEAKKKRESNIATKKLAFLTLIEEAQGGVEGLVISDQEEHPPQPLAGGTLTKRTFSFKIRSTNLDDALKFLVALEGKVGRIILTEELLIRSPGSSEDRLNLTVRIATWEREEDLLAADEDEGEDRS